MGRQALALLLALIAAAAVYGALAWRAHEAPPPAPHVVEIAKERPEDMPPDHLDRRERARLAGETAVASGEAVELDSRTLAPGKPVVLRLLLAEPSRTAEPLAGRLIGTDGRTLDLAGALGADRLDARVEVDPGFLRPGRYMLEVATTEQSHFPRRRYVIIVK
jgi:hypothetical protein